jgi:hypothetical protein
MDNVHFFDCPGEPDATIVVVAYYVGSTIFLTAHKHAIVEGTRTQIPTAQETPDDARFIEQCKSKVAEQLRAEGKAVLPWD